MKRAGLVVSIIFLCLFSLAVHAAPVGTFSKVSGRVDLTRDGAPARSVHTGDEVTVGDIIRAKSNAKAEIVFIDESILRIAQKSRVKISDYTVEKGQKSGVFNLFRGKIENVVKKCGNLFGFGEKSKFEVHTVTAVCGVRGTDFFSMHQGGLSSFIFKEGQGYGYTKNRPDDIVDIVAGQAMLVARPDLPPIVRPARPEEIARHAEDTAAGENGEDEGDDGESQKGDEAAGNKQGDETSKDQQKGDDGAKEENGEDNTGKDDQQGDKYQANQDSEGDVPEDRKPGDDGPSDPEPGSRKSGDHKQGNGDRGDGKHQYYARNDERPGDDDGEDKTFRPGDRGDRRREDDRRGEYDPRGDRRNDRRPGDYGPKNDRRGDYGPGNERQGSYRGGGPPPQGEDYGPYGPPPPGNYGPGDYRGEGPPPGGNYDPYGPPPPGNYRPGDYRAEGPPPGRDYGPYGPPPENFRPLSYGGGGPPLPGGDYGPYGPPPPEDFFGGPGEFFAGDFGPGDYWGEGPPPGGDYGPYGPPPPEDFFGGPNDFYGDPYAGDFYGDPYVGDFYGDPYYDDFYGDPYATDFMGDNWYKPFDGYWGPDIGYEVSDYVEAFRVDDISISGDATSNRYNLTMSGVYNWDPPFVYIYEDIKGELGGNIKSGYYLGFTGAGWDKYGSHVGGIASFFYVATDTTGGLLMGDISGNYYSDTHKWNASGSLEWVQLGTGLTVPGSLAEVDDYARDTFFVAGHGDFYDSSGNDVGDMNISRLSGIFDSIEEDQHWGYWRNKLEGSHTGNDDQYAGWFCQWEQYGLEEPSNVENLRLYMSAVGGDSYYSYGEFDGEVTGGWVDIEHAVTGIAAGGLHGGYDPSGTVTDFFAASGGVWIDTETLLTKLGTSAGRAELEKLKIPNLQIGKATLAGNFNDGGGNGIDVTMNDVTFLSYRSGDPPRIWASSNVAGTYQGTPSAGMTAHLTQTAGTDAAGVNADFSVRIWDTTSNKWSATVTDGTGTVGGHDISFAGGACGTITPAGTLIGGTAAGWAK